MIDELTLATGADIVFKKGRLVIHQPTIKEIGLIGEDTFFLGIQLLRLSGSIQVLVFECLFLIH